MKTQHSNQYALILVEKEKRKNAAEQELRRNLRNAEFDLDEVVPDYDFLVHGVNLLYAMFKWKQNGPWTKTINGYTLDFQKFAQVFTNVDYSRTIWGAQIKH